ncbi:dirigent protein 5-like [Triticum dicoccoides]|uniref:dirigent protein 5-like n=1 Tax=Triticum dicoccoides TaxID=85692 RepID=UPI001890CECA|nr:dirigent protein 5-like [Triticum dicoccoides]
MASPFGVLVCLLIVLPQIIAISSPIDEIAPLKICQFPCMTEVNLHLFLHQFVDGPSNPNRNEETLLQASFPFGFGTTIVHDWTLTETTNSTDTVVACVQGVHVQAGLTKPNRWYTTHNIEFQQGRFAGSTLQVMGITAGLESGQWSIVGGTGHFIMAQGIISFTNHPASTFEDGIKELNIRVRFTRDITQAA